MLPQMLHEGAEGFLADVMLDPFPVRLRDDFRHP